MFLVIGTLASIATGIGLPLVSILFGNVTDDARIDTGGDYQKEIADSMKPTSYKMFYIGAGIFVVAYLMFAFWMMVGERVAI